jgi:hypothetical protein
MYVITTLIPDKVASPRTLKLLLQKSQIQFINLIQFDGFMPVSKTPVGHLGTSFVCFILF